MCELPYDDLRYYGYGNGGNRCAEINSANPLSPCVENPFPEAVNASSAKAASYEKYFTKVIILSKKKIYIRN